MIRKRMAIVVGTLVVIALCVSTRPMVRADGPIPADPQRPGPPSARGIQPVEYDGNPTCIDFAPDGEVWTELKVDPVKDGQYSDEYLVVTIDQRPTDDGPVFDWTSNASLEAIFVKGGPNGNSYDYSDVDYEWDNDLHASINPNTDKYFGLSHISFCYIELCPTPTPSPTPPQETPSPTPPEVTPSPTPTEQTPSPTPTEETPSPTPTAETPSPTPTQQTPTPTGTPAPAPSPTPTEVTPSPTPTEETPSPTPTEETPSPTPTEETPSPTPTEETPSPTPTEETPSPTPTEETPSPTPTEETPSPTPTEETPTPVPDPEMTPTPTEETPTPEPDPDVTPTPAPEITPTPEPVLLPVTGGGSGLALWLALVGAGSILFLLSPAIRRRLAATAL